MIFLSKIVVPANHPCFPGHFPGNPLVPGALLLAWVDAEMRRSGEGWISHLRQAKFLLPVRPGDNLTCEIVLDKEQHTGRFSLSCDHGGVPQKMATGRFEFSHE